jgi:transcriptional regulator with XRE-family HTH domain
LARQLGVSPAFLSSVELGRATPLIDARIEDLVRAIPGLDRDAAFIAAGRLPPEMRPHLAEIIKRWRKQQRRALR